MLLPRSRSRRVPALPALAALALAVLALAALAPACASEPGERRWAVERCDPEAAPPPQIAAACRADERFIEYAKSVQERMTESVSDPWRDGGAATLRIRYGPGPAVRSICIARAEGGISPLELQRAGRRIHRLPVPRALDCLAGRRVDVAYRDEVPQGAPELRPAPE